MKLCREGLITSTSPMYLVLVAGEDIYINISSKLFK